jgi:hypothetical protein
MYDAICTAVFRITMLMHGFVMYLFLELIHVKTPYVVK